MYGLPKNVRVVSVIPSVHLNVPSIGCVMFLYVGSYLLI